MNTVNDLDWFLGLEEPIGALLITGEWGCGKTYLINEYFKEKEKKEKFYVVQVSLFAQNSPDDIHKKIKLLYFSGNKLDDESKFAPLLNILKEKLPKIINKIPTIGDAAEKLLESILSFNYLDFVEIESKVDGKELIIVFDDLERSNMPIDDLLGVINDYAEQKKIKTIIIANENTINKPNKQETDENSKLSKYKDIKEKVISNTVKHIPDYVAITSGIIEAYKCESKYKEFLRSNKSMIYAIFQTSKCDNIRSLKCAMQDFERVYKLINIENLDDSIKNKILYNFLVLVFEFKSGNLEEHNEYGYLLKDNELSNKYVEYSSAYTIQTIRNWVKTGDWVKEDIESEINNFVVKAGSKKPEDLFMIYSLLDVEEETLNIGFPIIINKAYEGELDFDEYCVLLQKFMQARSFGIEFPEEINLSNILHGVESRIKNIKEGIIVEPDNHAFIYEDENLIGLEKQIYGLVEKFRTHAVYYSNKSVFIKAFKDKDADEISQCFSLKYAFFDVEMAIYVHDYYIELDNMGRHYFCNEFLKNWRRAIHFYKDDLLITISGLTELAKLLEKSCSEENIKGSIDNAFIMNIANSITDYQDNESSVLLDYDNQQDDLN